jgi:antitoxin (DNA-binding transcriptional repressor) of toxin-antitoxin stability system
MCTIPIIEFRRRAEQIIQAQRKGERMVLTYCYTPLARMEPIKQLQVDAGDPFDAFFDSVFASRARRLE